MPSKRAELKKMVETVDRLADAMKRKLRRKFAEGYSGGLHIGNLEIIERTLFEHVERLTGRCPSCRAPHSGRDPKQAVDVANIAMMLWTFEEDHGPEA